MRVQAVIIAEAEVEDDDEATAALLDNLDGFAQEFIDEDESQTTYKVTVKIRLSQADGTWGEPHIGVAAV